MRSLASLGLGGGLRRLVSPSYLGFDRNLFRAALSPEQKVAIFRRYVRRIEVEVHSFCNRKCWFCPNSFIDRRSEIHRLDMGVFRSLLTSLAAIEYRHEMTFCKYNEPFADESTFEAIALARSAIPRATLRLNSNGDYLDAPTLKRAYDCGLRYLYVSLYTNEPSYDNASMRAHGQKIIRRLEGAQFRLVADIPDREVNYDGRYKDLRITLRGRNFRVEGVNRGGIAVCREASNRINPCFMPFWYISVEYNAQVMPCCNIRSDNPQEAALSLGTLSEANSIFDLYASPQAVAWRRRMHGFAKKTGPCAQCTMGREPSNIINRMLCRLTRPF